MALGLIVNCLHDYFLLALKLNELAANLKYAHASDRSFILVPELSWICLCFQLLFSVFSLMNHLTESVLARCMVSVKAQILETKEKNRSLHHSGRPVTGENNLVPP